MASSPSPRTATTARSGRRSATPSAAARAQPIAPPMYRWGPSPDASRSAEVAVPSEETNSASGAAPTAAATASDGFTLTSQRRLEDDGGRAASLVGERQRAGGRRAGVGLRRDRERLDAQRGEQRRRRAAHGDLGGIRLAEGPAHREHDGDAEAVRDRER